MFQDWSHGLNAMVMNIVVVIKKAVILVLRPNNNKIPPNASVKPADQAKTSGIKENGNPKSLVNSTNQSDTSNNWRFIDLGVQGVPNLLIANTNARR